MSLWKPDANGLKIDAHSKQETNVDGTPLYNLNHTCNYSQRHESINHITCRVCGTWAKTLYTGYKVMSMCACIIVRYDCSHKSKSPAVSSMLGISGIYMTSKFMHNYMVLIYQGRRKALTSGAAMLK